MGWRHVHPRTHCAGVVWDSRYQVTALQVALCMSGLKLIRAEVNPFEPDSFDDAHGYLRIAQAIVDGEPQPEDRP